MIIVSPKVKSKTNEKYHSSTTSRYRYHRTNMIHAMGQQMDRHSPLTWTNLDPCIVAPNPDVLVLLNIHDQLDTSVAPWRYEITLS